MSTLVTSHVLHPPFGLQILSNHKFSVADAAGISAELQSFVNPCAAILCALPVMSIVVSHRRIAVVCLNHRLSTIVAKRQCLHRHRSYEERIVAIRTLVDATVGNVCPATIVLECGVGESRSARRIRDALADWAENKGLRVIEVSRHDASEDICGERSLRAAFERIASRYPILSEESSASRNPTQVSIHEWEARLPLITAFVLAHAVAARAVVKAYGRNRSAASKPYETRIP